MVLVELGGNKGGLYIPNLRKEREQILNYMKSLGFPPKKIVKRIQ